jgi:hypothetical protein
MVHVGPLQIYRDYPQPPSLQCCARNILTVLRETLTQYISTGTLEAEQTNCFHLPNTVLSTLLQKVEVKASH